MVPSRVKFSKLPGERRRCRPSIDRGDTAMQQLTGMDGMFFSVDTSTSLGVMGGLIVYDKPSDPDAASRDRMVARITERLDYIPPLRRVLTPVPLKLDKEYWAESQVDVPAHVRSQTVGGQGTDQDLATMIAKMMTVPMDKKRPLWDLCVIDGLEGGRLAHLLRIHHGVIDGASIPLVLDLLSDHPTVAFDPADAPGKRKEPAWGQAEMLARGAVGVATRPVRFIRLQVSTVKYLVGRRSVEGVAALPAFVARMLPGKIGAPLRGAINVRQRKKGQPEVRAVLPQLRKPSTPFNKTITANRTFAFSDLPLADFKAVGKAFDVTLNDVVVSVCAGVLRRYLQSRGPVPKEPLVVCIPYSLRTGEEAQRWANHISMFFAPFPTNIEDPLERLNTVHNDLLAARENFDALPKELFREASRFIPQAFFAVHQNLLSKAPDWISGSTWNVVVSNVRGPSKPVEVAGARIAGYWPAAFLTTGVGLNITLQSYLDRIDFGLMGARDLTGDLWELPGYMADELQVLLAAARSKATSGAPSTTRPAAPSAADKIRAAAPVNQQSAENSAGTPPLEAATISAGEAVGSDAEPAGPEADPDQVSPATAATTRSVWRSSTRTAASSKKSAAKKAPTTSPSP